MLQIDFYVIQEQSPYAFACRVIEKAYQKGHQVWVETDSVEQAKQLDDLLWTFNDISFIPHGLADSEKTTHQVTLNPQINRPHHNDILINFSSTVPNFYTDFQRIIEFVSNDEQWRAISRQHFQYYRDQNFEINTHKI